MCISQAEIAGVYCSRHLLQEVFPVIFNQQHGLFAEMHVDDRAFATDERPWRGRFVVLRVFRDLSRDGLCEVRNGVEKRTVEQDLAVVEGDNVGEGVEVLDIV